MNEPDAAKPDAAKPDAAQPDAALDKALRIYAEVGLSPERTVGQLLRAGFSPEQLRARFPGVPERLLAAPVAPDPKLRQALTRPRAPSIAAHAGQGGAALPPTAAQLLQPLLTRRVTEHPAATRAPAILAGGLSFQYVPLIQCSFPHADPGATAHYTRRNGWLELTLSTARPDTGLPYGVPARLLTMYCASEAIRTHSPEIYLGASVHEFLRRLEVPITRGERGSLRVYANQLLRLIHCALSIDENIRDGAGRTGLHIRQTLFVEEAQLWWDEQAGVGQGSSLVLSPVLYDSILERSAPLSTAAIRQLRKSPMDLDVYAWLVHRLFHLSRPSTLTWQQLSGQFGHNYGELRYFRRFFGDSLQRVLKVYPEARLQWTDAGLTLLPSRPHVERAPSPRS